MLPACVKGLRLARCYAEADPRLQAGGPHVYHGMKPPIDPLESLLERLKTAAPPQPGSVSRDVWRRIADAEAVASPVALFERIEMAFRRPAFAALFVVGCVLGGLFFAELRVSRLHENQSAQLEQNYLRLVDPLLARPPTALQR